MKKRHFIFFLMVVAILANCFFSPVHSLSKEDKLWKAYDKGDTILFMSNNQMDTLIVDNSYIKYYYWPFVSPEGPELNDEYIYMFGKLLHNNDSLGCYLEVKKISFDYLKVELCLNYRASIFWRSKQIKWKQMIVNNDTLRDVIRVDKTNSKYYQERVITADDVESYYWSKSMGLIKYKYYSGDTYYFVEKRKRK